MCCAELMLSHIQLFATQWTVAHQAPQSMRILQARILEWVAMPPPGDLLNPGIEPRSPALQADFLSSQFSSVAQSCPTLCDPMSCSTPGLPVHHHLLEFTQTHVHQVGDAIQPSHPLSSPSPPAPNPSQHQILFQ